MLDPSCCGFGLLVLRQWASPHQEFQQMGNMLNDLLYGGEPAVGAKVRFAWMAGRAHGKGRQT